MPRPAAPASLLAVVFVVATLGFTPLVRAAPPSSPGPANPAAVAHPTTTAAAAPVTRAPGRSLGAVDAVMQDFRTRIDCTAASVAISQRGRLLYAAGFGWLDREHTRPTPPDALLGIASCDKPVTAAAIRQLARRNKLSLTDSIYRAAGVPLPTTLADPRVRRIIVEHVLTHRAGWGGDIRPALAALARAHTLPEPDSVPTLLRAAALRPLTHAPGTHDEYSNFGFEVLRHVIGETSGPSAAAYFRDRLLAHTRLRDIGSSHEPAPDHPRTVWNLADGGPTCASAPWLGAFMAEYWLTGEPRESGNPLWVMHGSLPGSTALMIWRSDGIDVVALFNGRNATTHDALAAALEKAL